MASTSGSAPRVRSREANSWRADADLRREVGPAFVDEEELGERALPEQEIGDALLAAGANQEVDVCCAAGEPSDRTAAKASSESSVDFVEAASGAVDRVAGGVIDREAQMQSRAARGCVFGIDDRLAEMAERRSRRPMMLRRMPSSMQCCVSVRRYSCRMRRMPATSAAGRFQLADEKANSVSVWMPSWERRR